MHINLIVIRTKDPKVLAEFYQLMGLEFQYHRHGKGVWHYSATINNVVFEIYPLLKSQQSPDQSLRLGFVVDNLDDLIEKLRSQSVKIISAPQSSEWGYFAVISDPDGRKIELTES